MQKKRRSGRASTKTSLEDEIAHLRGLALGGLRARWQSVFQRSAPAHLTRHLLFAVIAYRLQADRFGDLDHETKQVLRCDRRSHSRTSTVPGVSSVRFWSKLARRVNIAGPVSLASVRSTLCQRARNPPRSRPRRCAISSSRDVLVEARPLRRLFCIASGRLFGPVRSGRRSFSILVAIDTTFVGLFSKKVEPQFLSGDNGQQNPDRML